MRCLLLTFRPLARLIALKGRKTLQTRRILIVDTAPDLYKNNNDIACQITTKDWLLLASSTTVVREVLTAKRRI
jgi:hypothetical protein